MKKLLKGVAIVGGIYAFGDFTYILGKGQVIAATRRSNGYEELISQLKSTNMHGRLVAFCAECLAESFDEK